MQNTRCARGHVTTSSGDGRCSSEKNSHRLKNTAAKISIRGYNSWEQRMKFSRPGTCNFFETSWNSTNYRNITIIHTLIRSGLVAKYCQITAPNYDQTITLLDRYIQCVRKVAVHLYNVLEVISMNHSE
jgi:hypothetical protein